MKILTVVGARPQFIKAAMVSKVLGNIEEVIVHTGQHYDANMSDLFFQELTIPTPNYHLGIGSDTHGAQTGKMLEAIEQVLIKEKPDCLLVYGDTNSTMAGALAAVKLHIPVAHVEAGLRSYNRKMPEEINRITTDHVSEFLFTPTDTASKILLKEGISQNNIHQVGDVMYDAVRHYSANSSSQVLSTLNLLPDEYYLVTVHRAENTDDKQRLLAIFGALMNLEHPVVLPLHPRTEKYLKQYGLYDDVKSKLTLIEPIGYLDMLHLTRDAKCVLTDSGGLQKEAYFAKTPCVTLRDETEWVELVEHGWNHLAPPTSSEAILAVVGQCTKQLPQHDLKLYGDGFASEKIVAILDTLIR